MNFGEKLKQLRHEQSWTQPEAAEAIGIEQSYLSKLENDKSQPSSEVFQQVLIAFKVEVEALLAELSPKAQKQLKSIPDVKEYYERIKQQSVESYRAWLIGAMILFSISALLFAMGYFKVIPPNVLYKYQSYGVTKEGESINLFDNHTSLKHMIPPEDYRALRKDMILREDPIVIHTYQFKGEQYVDNVEQGKRLYYLSGSDVIEMTTVHAWFKVLGCLFFSLSLGSVFLASRWR